MSRRILLFSALFVMLIATGATILLFKQRPQKAPITEDLSQIGLFTPTPTPLPVLKDFIILPNDYKLLPEDITLLSNKNIKNILLEDPSNDYMTTVSTQLPGLIVSPLTQSSEYRFCNLSIQAVSPPSAYPNSIQPHYLSYGPCDELHKLANVQKANCSLSSEECQDEYLISLREGAYYYNPKSPLLSLVNLPNLQVNNPFGTEIITWENSNQDILSQTSYSVELLNQLGKRVYASGRISSQIQGDYYSPTASLLEQTLSVKLRLWLQYKSIKFQSPLVLTSDFAYSPYSSPTSTTTSPVMQMSWIPDWGMTDGIASVKANPKKWNTISPVWFNTDKNGSLIKTATANSSTVMSLLRKNNIKIIPTISLFDADILKEILNKHQSRHISEIVKVAVSNNYDGIDLDYESTYADDKALLLQFITELASQLHAKGKTLTFTALPKIDDRAIYAFLPQTHEAQDWKAIGAVVDEFRIMAYDFTGQGSLQPGPLSPYAWNETLIRYAIAQMPAEKVVLALPLYAHGWPKPKTTNLAGTNNDHSLSSGEQKNTISPQHDNIAYIKSHSTYYRSKYDTAVKEVRAEFKYNGVERVMYYLDKTAVNERLQLAQKYGIKGVCYWRIGGEYL